MAPDDADAPSTERLTDRKRQAIVQAAIAEFRDNGFDATSMDKVAASAGVSKRTVYNHFPSKEALFAEILRQLWHSSRTQPDVAYDARRPLDAQLREILQRKVGMLADTNFLALSRVAMAEVIHSPERARDMVARLGDREEGLTVWLRAAAADGRLKPVDPEFAAHQLYGMVKGFAFWPQVTLGQPPLTPEQQRQVVETAVQMFLGYYTA